MRTHFQSIFNLCERRIRGYFACQQRRNLSRAPLHLSVFYLFMRRTRNLAAISHAIQLGDRDPRANFTRWRTSSSLTSLFQHFLPTLKSLRWLLQQIKQHEYHEGKTAKPAVSPGGIHPSIFRKVHARRWKIAQFSFRTVQNPPVFCHNWLKFWIRR